MLCVHDVNIGVCICMCMHTKTIYKHTCSHIDTYMCMHWLKGELLRSPMALKILRKGDVIRLKQATSLHSIQMCLMLHIIARNPAFQNWGATVLRKFGEHSCASHDTLFVLLAFDFAHR